MQDLELTISRYLDGELTSQEEQLFQKILQESPEAQALLRQTEEIRSVARLFPALTTPSAHTENRLFQQLFVEEPVEEGKRGIIPLLSRITESAWERAGSLVPAVLLIFTLGSGLWFAFNQGSEPQAESIANRLHAPTTFSTTDNQLPSDAIATEAYASDSTPASKIKNNLPNYIASVPVRIVHHTQEGTAPALIVDSAAGNQIIDNNHVKEPLNEYEQSTSTSPEIPFAQNQDHENPSSSIATTDKPQIVDNALSLPSSSLTLPTPSKSSGRLRASYHHGVAASVVDNNFIAAQDLNIRVDGRLNDQHRLSLAVGQSPLLVWERQNVVAENDEKKGPQTASGSYTQSQRFDDELWAGVGYGYALVKNDLIRLEAGVNLGVGERSFRYGVELPASIDITDKLALDITPFASRVAPYNQQVQDVSQTEEEQTLDFTTVGAHIGLSLSIGK